jgi:hypothetical protein
MKTDAEHEELLRSINARFRVTLQWYKGLKHRGIREDVTIHGFFVMSDEEVSEDLKQEIRRWVEGQGWQFSRQLIPCDVTPGELTEYVYLAPMIHVALETGYHATRRVAWSAIREEGLFPSTPERQTTEKRLDCEGNIYVCERLGTPADDGVRGAKSAHWWRAHLAGKSRFRGEEWVILEVRLGGLPGARIYQDIWSESGVIVGNVDSVPPERLRLVYPNGGGQD